MDDLKRVMEEYGDAVYRCAYMYCRNESDAEDITQEVFCRYLEKHPAFRDERHEKAWLLRVAINLSKNHIRSYWNQHTQGLDEAISIGCPSTQWESETAESLENSDIAEYIERLPGWECRMMNLKRKWKNTGKAQMASIFLTRRGKE